MEAAALFLPVIAAVLVTGAEPSIVSLETVEVVARRESRLDRVPVRHPEEAFPPDVIDLLRGAETAQTFLWRAPRRSRFPSDGVVVEGWCLRGRPLRLIVALLLDPTQYEWASEYGRIPPQSDEPIPRLGIEFRRGHDFVVLMTTPEFETFTLVQPTPIHPGGLFNPDILSGMAKDHFPEAGWSVVDHRFERCRYWMDD